MAGSAIRPDDRLGMTLFLATVAHGIVILGVGFGWEAPAETSDRPMMEVTIAQQEAPETPEDYDFLAAIDQDGGGIAEDPQVPDPAAGVPMPPVTELEELDAGGEQPAEPTEEPPLTTEQAERTVPDHEEAAAPEASAPDMPHSRSPEAAEAAEIERRLRQPREPSKRFISARTRAHEAAEYMEEWVRKVEAVGNLNYPDEARERGLSGRLVLEVTLLPDGEVEEVRVVSGSPHRLLDEAAVRTVELATPFPSVPEEVLDGQERLVITRTWAFVDGERIEAR